MRRREFIAGLGGAAAWPLVARAQQSERMRRIGALLPYDEDPTGSHGDHNVSGSFVRKAHPTTRDFFQKPKCLPKN